MSRRRPRVPAPPHRRRPLAVAETEPFEILDTAHGLQVLMYRAVGGTCTCCHHHVPRVARDRPICFDCARWCTPDEACLCDDEAAVS